MSSRGSLMVLFAADCGFCAHCAMVLQKLDRSRRLAFLPLQDAASVLTGVPGPEELAMTLHVRDHDGQWVRGGAACLRIAAALPVLMPLAFAGRLPFASVVVEGAYRLVARNRDQLSRLLGLDGCRFEPVEAVRA